MQESGPRRSVLETSMLTAVDERGFKAIQAARNLLLVLNMSRYIASYSLVMN